MRGEICPALTAYFLCDSFYSGPYSFFLTKFLAVSQHTHGSCRSPSSTAVIWSFFFFFLISCNFIVKNADLESGCGQNASSPTN